MVEDNGQGQPAGANVPGVFFVVSVAAAFLLIGVLVYAYFIVE